MPFTRTLPSGQTDVTESYLAAKHTETNGTGQVNYGATIRKFFVSLMKTFYGDKAQKENNWGFDWLPGGDKGYDVLRYFDMMDKGEVNGYICRGFKPVSLIPEQNKVVKALSN